MISAIENLSPEIREQVMSQLDNKIFNGAVVSRFTYTEYISFIRFFQSLGLTSDEYYEHCIDRFSPDEYQLMLAFSKSIDNPELKQKLRIMNQRCKRIVNRLVDGMQEQNNKRWWKL